MTVRRSWQSPEPADVPSMRSHVLAHVSDRLSPDDVAIYAIALTEILANAVEARPSDSTEPLIVSVGPDAVVVTNPRGPHVPIVKGEHQDTVERGRGLQIATTLWPTLSWRSDDATVTTTLPGAKR